MFVIDFALSSANSVVRYFGALLVLHTVLRWRLQWEKDEEGKGREGEEEERETPIPAVSLKL